MSKFIYKAIIFSAAFLFMNCSSVKLAEAYSYSSNPSVIKTASISEKKPKKEKKIKRVKKADKKETEESETKDDLPETIEEPVEVEEKKEEFIKEETVPEEKSEEISEDSQSEEGVIDDSPTLEEPVLLEEPIFETEYEKALRKAKEKELKKQRKEQEKRAKQLKKDPYTGWFYIKKRNFKVDKGDIQLVLRGRSGTFGLYAIPESGSRRPLLATSDDYASTFFAVKAGRQEYQLNRESGVSCEARETDYGAQLAYKIKNKFQFVADFSLMPSISTSSRIDVIRVTLYTTNLSRNTQSFAVKGVFDTMLGENTYQHFSTAARSRINSETQFTDMSVDKWIRSSNDKAAVQFILNGKGITKPKSVSLANKDILSAKANWELSLKDQRSFSSVLAYNNSAMSINWRTSYLDPLKTDVITFYISVSTDDREPAGRELIDSLAKGKTALPPAIPATAVLSDIASMTTQVTPEETATEFHDNMPVISGDPEAVLKPAETDENLIIPSDSPAADSSSAGAVQPETIQNTDGLVSAVPVNISETPVSNVVTEEAENPDDKTRLGFSQPQAPSVSEKQIDPEYIQDLLDRIAELENDTALVDRAEINRLNAELDAILSQLRSME